jgi:hypothetical protein
MTGLGRCREADFARSGSTGEGARASKVAAKTKSRSVGSGFFVRSGFVFTPLSATYPAENDMAAKGR